MVYLILLRSYLQVGLKGYEHAITIHVCGSYTEQGASYLELKTLKKVWIVKFIHNTQLYYFNIFSFKLIMWYY